MKIAYTMSDKPGHADDVLAEVANGLIASGLRVAGVVQSNSRPCADQRCDMDVRVLPDGGTYRISQTLGTGARGCRLDPQALEEAVSEVAAGLDAEIDVLVVNKFGKHEAEGRGFRPLIAEMAGRGVPVVTGVSAASLGAFREFAGDLAEFVEPDATALRRWLDEVIERVAG